MASNGIIKRAKAAPCRMCRRVRKTEDLKPVADVLHGFATGHLWECLNEDECDGAAYRKLNDQKTDHKTRRKIEQAQDEGRYKQYLTFK